MLRNKISSRHTMQNLVWIFAFIGHTDCEILTQRLFSYFVSEI